MTRSRSLSVTVLFPCVPVFVPFTGRFIFFTLSHALFACLTRLRQLILGFPHFFFFERFDFVVFRALACELPPDYMALCGECESRVAVGVQCATCDTWYHSSATRQCVPQASLGQLPFMCRFCHGRLAGVTTQEAVDALEAEAQLPAERIIAVLAAAVQGRYQSQAQRVADVVDLRRILVAVADDFETSSARSTRLSSSSRNGLLGLPVQRRTCVSQVHEVDDARGGGAAPTGSGGKGALPSQLSSLDRASGFVGAGGVAGADAEDAPQESFSGLVDAIKGEEWWRHQRLADCFAAMATEHREMYFRRLLSSLDVPAAQSAHLSNAAAALAQRAANDSVADRTPQRTRAHAVPQPPNAAGAVRLSQISEINAWD